MGNVGSFLLCPARFCGVIESPDALTTNAAKAKEYEGVTWGFSSTTSAWNTLFVDSYPSNIAQYGEVFDDPGWIKGTRAAYGKEGAFMWILQNTLEFTTPGSTYWTNAGRTYLLENVLVGTLGDYAPGTVYTNVFPQMDDPDATNWPGCPFLTSAMPASNQTVRYSFNTTSYYHLIRPNIVLSSDAAINSPRHFEFGSNDLFHACTRDLAGTTEEVGGEEQQSIDAALTVYYKDVRDSTGGVQQFDITLTETPALTNEVTWSLVSGPPDSGTLTNAILPVATFSNPTKGGRYIFNVNIRGVDTKSQAWLPVAGPDISYYWSNEIVRIKQWGVSYRSNLNERANLPGPPLYGGSVDAWYRIMLRTRDFLSFGLHLDWNIPTNQVAYDLLYNAGNTPCGLADVVTTNSSMGDVCRFTMHGIVIDAAKRNNMGFALVAKEMGFSDIDVLYGPDLFGYLQGMLDGSTDVGTPDSAAARESYRAGIDLHDGSSLEAVMANRGLDMLEPGMRAEKEWPSYESTTGGLVLKEEANTKMEELVE